MTETKEMISLKQLEQILDEDTYINKWTEETDKAYGKIERWENRLYEAIATWKEEGYEEGEKHMKEVLYIQNKMMDEVEYPEILIDCLLSYFNYKIQKECFGKVLY